MEGSPAGQAYTFDPALIPDSVANELLDVVEHRSAALALGTTVRMPSGAMTLPVVSTLPQAGFVNPRYGGRKPATKVEWSSEQIVPEEIACTLAIPEAFIDDVGFPVWDQVRPLVASAIAMVLDDAVLWGTGAPATFPTGGVSAAAGTPVTGADALEAIDAAMSAIEASGLLPDGIASGTAIGSALRAEYRAQGALPSTVPERTIYGLPVEVTPAWDAAEGDALVGDWSKLVIGIRQDIRFDLSDTAILQDAAGAIIANAFQEDLVAMRAYIRVGAAIGVPIGPYGAGQAWSMADWTAVVPLEGGTATRRSSSSSRKAADRKTEGS